MSYSSLKIKSLHLHNFQKHGDLSLEDFPHLSTIVGATDRGKSAILRALRWVLTNSPSGTGMIKKGEKEAQVTLTLESNGREIEIKRTRSESKNLYEIDGKEYKAFGQGVPDVLTKIFPFSSIHYQGQHDSPFWLLSSAGEVARNLNEVINLDLIDRVLSTAASEVKSTQKELDKTRLTLDEVEKKIESLKGVEERRKSLLKIKELREKKISLEEDLSKVTRFQELLKERVRLESLVEKGRILVQKFKDYISLSQKVENLGRILGDLSKLREIPKPPPFRPIEEGWKRWTEKKEEVVDLTDLLERIRHTKETLVEVKSRMERVKKEFKEKTKGEVCPLCGQKINL